MKTKIILFLSTILLLSCYSARPQSFSTRKDYGKSLLKKRDIVPLACSILGGVSNGMNRAYYATSGTCFETKFGAPKQGFFGSEGWKRKYKNYDEGLAVPKFPGSTTFLAFSTNAPAFTNLSNKGFVFLGTVTLTINRKDDFLNHFHRFVFNGLVYGLSSWATNNYLTNK